MRLLHGLDGMGDLPRGGALTIGNFDGVHLGHRRILDALGDGPKIAVTFEPHPATVLRPDLAPPRLTTIDQKRRLLENAGVAALLELPPTAQVLGLSAEDFWAKLRGATQPRRVVEGEDFRFGSGRGGDVQLLRAHSGGAEIVVVDAATATLHDCSVVDIGSTLVRWLIAHGRVSDANRCLGRPFQLVGEVIRGYGRGRQLGIPTANLRVDQLIPADGVYAATVDGRRAALSVGMTPTFDGLRRQVEVHLIGFDGDLYDRTLAVDVLHWVRPQVKFSGVDALLAQLQRDFSAIAAVQG